MVVPLRTSGYEIGRSVTAVITWLCGMNRTLNSTPERSVNYCLICEYAKLASNFNEKKFKQWWSTIPLISTKRTVTSHFKSLNQKNTTTYRNQTCIGIKLALNVCAAEKHFRQNTIPFVITTCDKARSYMWESSVVYKRLQNHIWGGAVRRCYRK